RRPNPWSSPATQARRPQSPRWRSSSSCERSLTRCGPSSTASSAAACPRGRKRPTRQPETRRSEFSAARTQCRADQTRTRHCCTEPGGRKLAWANTSDAAARAVQQRILGIENGIKVRRNELKALLNDDMMAQKAAAERELREAVMNDPELAERYGNAWKLIEDAVEAHRNMYEEHLFIEEAAAFQSDLFGYARDIVRGTAEREKPNEERLRGYTETALPTVEARLFAERPIDRAYEKLTLEFSLDKMREYL